MLSDGRHSYIHKYESNASMLSRVIFYLKSVTFLFLFSIDSLVVRVLTWCARGPEIKSRPGHVLFLPGFEMPISPRVNPLGWVLSLILEKWGVLGNKIF